MSADTLIVEIREGEFQESIVSNAASRPSDTRPPWPRAAVSTAVFREGHVLLIERGKGAMRGLWSLPGGHVEPGEPVREAARREVLEETGVVIDLRGIADVHDVIMRAADGTLRAHYILSVFYGDWLSGEPVAQSDAAGARFVALNDVSRYNLTDGVAGIIARAARRQASLPTPTTR